MKLSLHTRAVRTITTAICGAVLAACGGGSTEELSTSASMEGTRLLGLKSGRSVGTTSTTPTTTTTSTTTASTAAAVTSVSLENTNATAAQSNVPFTFGQVFAVGHLAKGTALIGRLDNGSMLPLQVDVKATHPDGSVRHAIVSGMLPTIGAAQVVGMELVKGGTIATAAAATTSQLLGSGFTSSVSATIGGTRYSASADELIKNGAAATWLAGDNVTEWHVSAPLKTATGATHPHLTARFAVRWYGAVKKARVDVTIENNWAYEPSPQNFVYDAEILSGGQSVYKKLAMTHYHHARWRKVVWFGGAAPQLHVKHNTAYLLDSRALPNFDRSLKVPETRLAQLKTQWTSANREPMGIGLAVPYMPQTGGRGDIGMLPNWGAIYLLSMDKRAAEATLGTADLAGSWSAHYRDKVTGLPVSVMNYPYMTISGRPGDTWNPVTKKYESFPTCSTATVDACKTPYSHDLSHQPAFAYLPYLLTGDYYYLEELQFWTMYNALAPNPYYRGLEKGLAKSDQVRGQAWIMRTLAEAAYITPDAHPLKSHFDTILSHNLDWYNTEYTNNVNANKLGIVTNGYAVVYNSNTGVAPWQDDFFTAAIGHVAELGFTKAVPLLNWKTKFAAQRMTAPGACWIDGSIYSLKVRDSATSPIYDTMAKAYTASHTSTFNALTCASAEMATALKLKVGEMTGYSYATAGYPANMQPALAYAADTTSIGKSAWTVFQSRSVKPDYATDPQWAIIPR